MAPIDQLQDEVNGWIMYLRGRIQEIKRTFATHRPRAVPGDLRDKVNFALAIRSVEFIESATDSFEHRRIAPAATHTRAVLETLWIWRWVLQDPANAALWFEKGDSEIQRMLRDMEATLGKPIEDPAARRVLEDDRITAAGFPNFRQAAEAVGMKHTYLAYYPALSNFTHPNRISLYCNEGDNLADVRESAAKGFLQPCLYVTNDVASVFQEWGNHRRIAPVRPLTPS